MNAVRWMEVPVQPASGRNESPTVKYGIGNSVVVYGIDSAYVGCADETIVAELLRYPDVRPLNADDLRRIDPLPGLPLTWESLEAQIPGQSGQHHLRDGVIGLGDLISSITRRARIPECGACTRRRKGLNRITVWGWWRARPAEV
ncbi:hypothetical protein [Streptomyces sp. TE33382]